ncbi:MAG: hypothetical protein JWO38_453 [Gemmataceae bacterium]|nr:hypothetical protein [Gemmataceae bacterium]
MSPRLRTLFVVLVGLAAGYFALDRLVSQPEFHVPRDFVEYWAAGAIIFRGGNPYDPAELLAWQQSADPAQAQAVMMWNPPWALAVYMPFGWLSARWAALVWLGLQLLAVRSACVMLWRVFDGPPPLWWVAPLVGLTFGGTLWTIIYGQNTGFLLLGLAGFAYHRKAGRPAVAGAFAALTGLKPHLLAAFGVLLVLDGVTRRGRIALACGAGLVAASLGLAILANPGVVDEYRAAVRDPGPGAVSLSDWALPVASYQLRMALAPDRFWVQFVPCGLACLGYAAYRLYRGSRWDWTAELPAVVWVSVLTTPYGGWIFDLTVLLVPVIRAAVWIVSGRRWVAGAVLAAGLLVVTTIPFVRGGGLHDYGWVAPAVLALYLAAAAVRVRGGPGR